MRRILQFTTLACGLVFLNACDLDDFGDFSDGSRYTEDFHHSYPLKAGGRLAIENFNGSVEISTWDQETLDISGTKYAPTPDLRDDIRIDIAATPDSVSIRTIRPSARRGNMGARFVIKAPRKVQLDRIVSSNGSIRVMDTEGTARLRTTNGAVRAENLHGTLDVQTSNGTVTLHELNGSATVRTTNGGVRADGVHGALEATTSNGGITARLVKSESGRTARLQTSNGGIDLTLVSGLEGDIRASTSNGGITVRMPQDTNARLIASTSNSSIKTEFDVKTLGVVNKHHLEGTIGSGGPAVDLSTTNGAIRILRQ